MKILMYSRKLKGDAQTCIWNTEGMRIQFLELFSCVAGLIYAVMALCDTGKAEDKYFQMDSIWDTIAGWLAVLRQPECVPVNTGGL